jgi:hypothetical protein
LLSASYSGVDAAAAQAAALAAFEANVRVWPASGVHSTLPYYTVAASLANPSALTLTIGGDNTGGANGDYIDVTVQYAPSAIK